MVDMTERLGKETKKLKTAEKRRKFDLEGYGADLQSMKKKIDFYQKYIFKLKNIVEENDEELLDEMHGLNGDYDQEQ